jgi:hypothetical protein
MKKPTNPCSAGLTAGDAVLAFSTRTVVRRAQRNGATPTGQRRLIAPIAVRVMSRSDPRSRLALAATGAAMAAATL